MAVFVVDVWREQPWTEIARFEASGTRDALNMSEHVILPSNGRSPVRLIEQPPSEKLQARCQSNRIFVRALAGDRHPGNIIRPRLSRRIALAEKRMPRSKMPQSLTTRQRVVLKHLLSGGSEQSIARKLGISFHTVHVHVKSIYRRYGVHSRPELMSKVLIPR